MAAYIANNNYDYARISQNTAKLGEFEITLKSILDRLAILEQKAEVVHTPCGGRRKLRKTREKKKKKKRKTRRKRK